MAMTLVAARIKAPPQQKVRARQQYPGRSERRYQRGGDGDADQRDADARRNDGDRAGRAARQSDDQLEQIGHQQELASALQTLDGMRDARWHEPHIARLEIIDARRISKSSSARKKPLGQHPAVDCGIEAAADDLNSVRRSVSRVRQTPRERGVS